MERGGLLLLVERWVRLKPRRNQQEGEVMGEEGKMWGQGGCGEGGEVAPPLVPVLSL